MKEQIVYKQVNELKNNPKNPRLNDDAVESVAKSIEKYGFRNPLIIDENNIVWCGNTRLKAAKKLGLKEAPCICVKDLTEKQMAEYALLDNKTNEIADWDYERLEEILAELDLDEFGLDWGVNVVEDETIEDNPYTTKVEIPRYEIKGDCPEINELVDEDKVNEIIKQIESSNIKNEIKEFLIKAAYRHYCFDYAKIAEFYAHQDKETQKLMENSALVIVDVNDAIKNGYAELKACVEELIKDD